MIETIDVKFLVVNKQLQSKIEWNMRDSQIFS
jgi:hypothetical protein